MNSTLSETSSGSRTRRAGRRTFVWLAGLAAVFLLAHLAFLPPTLEDIDSLNFALGLRDFDPTRHQPHAPGYPIFIALGKIARPVLPSEAAALAVWGAICGALAVFALMRLFRCLEECDRANAERETGVLRAALATLVVVTCPLFWFTALRPMSDVPGLAAVLVAQACLATAFVRQRTIAQAGPSAIAASGRMIVLGALVSGLAIGFRTQAVWLTLPLLAVVLLHRVGRGAAGALLGGFMTFSIGVLIWAVPLVVASGGLAAYVRALAAQAGEDLAGVDMLFRNPTLRRLAVGLFQTLVLPWAVSPLGFIVVGLACAGFLVMLRRGPIGAVLLAAVAVPYGVFHLTFQETVTTRYALPLVPAMGYLAVRGAWIFGRRVAPYAAAAVVMTSLAVTLPAAASYARHPSPVFEAIRQIRSEADATSGEAAPAVAMHQAFARAVQTEDLGRIRILKAPPMREWLELVNYWLEGNRAPVWFLADPARTDLELVDPKSRVLEAHYGWTFPRLEFMSGVRPDILDLVRIDSPPGWFCGEGWHLTSETLGMSEKQPRHEAVAYIRRRTDPVLLVLGGEQMGGSADPPAAVSVALDGRVIDRWNVRPGESAFFRRTVLAAADLRGESGVGRLLVSYEAGDGSARPVRIRLTQFAAQLESDVFTVFHAGWHEIEYNPTLQRRWRWASDRAVTFVNAAGRDLVLTVSGESPLRYFDAPPHIVIRAGDRVLARESPASDFEFQVQIPAAALEASDGMITLETDKSFVPAQQTRSPDERRLGLRIFRFEVADARPAGQS